MRKKPNALHSKVPQEQKFAEYVVDQGMQVVTFRTQTTSQKLLFANLSQEIQPKVPEKSKLSRRDDSILLALPFVFWKTIFRFQGQNLGLSYNKTIYKNWSFRYCCQKCLGDSNGLPWYWMSIYVNIEGKKATISSSDWRLYGIYQTNVYWEKWES